MARDDVKRNLPARRGRYEMLAPIASGGMASVWAARLRGPAGFSKVVAIKTMLPELADEPEYRAMFLDEARVASRLRHPNVCAALDAGDQDGSLYLAMEWIEGASLQRVLRGGPAAGAIAPRVAARIVADACAGLHAAHEAVDDDGTPLAVVHRDVSPHNVLLAIDGHVKVTDFGVAKALGKSHTTQAGQAKGKLAYMAPEQLCGPATDRRADVFALGCVLYEITTARKPFEGESDADVMKAVLRCEPTAPGVLVPGYPAELERIVQLAMARDPDDRFASAEGLRLALERWLAASGAAVAQREVASLVHARCGAEIEHRRAVIQQAMAIEPRVAVAPVVGAQAALGELGPPRRPRRGILALGAAVVALAVGSLVWHRPVEEARIEAPTPPDAPAVVVAPTAPVVAPPPTEREPSAPAASRIVLRVEPSRARVVVDGEPLPPDDDEGTFSFDRPPPGHSRLVLVKALGRVDARVVVDAATAPAVDLSLEQAEPSVLSSR